jgi:hypothetical protein
MFLRNADTLLLGFTASWKKQFQSLLTGRYHDDNDDDAADDDGNLQRQ